MISTGISGEKTRRPMHYVAQGEGQPVLLIHGIAASHHDWAQMAPALASAGYRTYAVDLPGHGESPKPGRPQFYHWKAIYRRLETWIDSLELKQPLALVGHSLGGYLSLRYALYHPERVRALVLIDPFYSQQQLSPVVRRLESRAPLGEKALRLLPEWLVRSALKLDVLTERNASPEARRHTALDLKRASPHIVRIPFSVGDLTPRLPEIRPQALVIWGEKDLTLNPKSFPRLARRLPCATGVPLAECRHQPHIARPQLVNRIVIDFLGKV